MKKLVIQIFACCTVMLALSIAAMKRSREASPERSRTAPIRIILPSPLLVDSEAPAPEIAIALNPRAEEPLSRISFAEILNNPHGALLAVIMHLDANNHTVYRVYDGPMFTQYLDGMDYRDPTSKQPILQVLYYLTPSPSEPLTCIGNQAQPGVVTALRALSGNANEIIALGVLFSHGVPGTKQDPLQAIKWFEKAAERGNLTAMNMMGLTYEKGSDDVEINYQTARTWFQKAADKNDPTAMVYLGLLYADGLGGEKDLTKALKLYKQAQRLNYNPQRADQKKALSRFTEKLTAAGVLKQLRERKKKE